MKLLCVTIAFILLGLGVGYVDAVKSIDVWSNFYYLWDKIKDLLLVLCLYYFVNNPQLKKAILFLSVFFIFRIIWDLMAITTSYEMAASPEIMMGMFTVWAAIIIIMIIKGVREEWQQRL